MSGFKKLSSTVVVMPEAHRNPTMSKLNWNMKVNLIGEKVVDPMIHCCELCDRPILVYGRMIPCKHVFCLECANRESANMASCGKKVCPRCRDPISKVERCNLGQIYVCTHGAPRHNPMGCRRTYLSNRDLQAHILHRHTPKSANPTSPTSIVGPSSTTSQPSSVPPISPVALTITPSITPSNVTSAQQQPSPMLAFASVGPPPTPPRLMAPPLSAPISMPPPSQGVTLASPHPQGVVSQGPPGALLGPPPGAGAMIHAPPPLIHQMPPPTVANQGAPSPSVQHAMIGHRPPALNPNPRPTNLITIPLQGGGGGGEQLQHAGGQNNPRNRQPHRPQNQGPLMHHGPDFGGPPPHQRHPHPSHGYGGPGPMIPQMRHQQHMNHRPPMGQHMGGPRPMMGGGRPMMRPPQNNNNYY